MFQILMRLICLPTGWDSRDVCYNLNPEKKGICFGVAKYRQGN